MNAAISELQKSAHTQFLAALPLAATLDDGEEGTLDAFRICRVDQARVTSATSSTFIDRIRRGEVPKLDSFELNHSTQNIQGQISLINSLKSTAAEKHGIAEQAIWKVKDSETQIVSEAQSLRFQFGDAILKATGINPGSEDVAPYFGLTTEPGRLKFREKLQEVIQLKSLANIGSAELVDGSTIGQAILQIRRAEASIRSSKNRIDSVPAQILIEEERVGAIDGVILGTESKISSYRLAIGIANSISISTGITAGVNGGAFISTSFNPSAIVASEFQNRIGRAQAIQQVEINNVNAEAAIRNLLLQQHQYTIDLETSIAEGQIAIANLNATLEEVDRLIENQIYYQESNSAKWYNDPSLVFERETAEIDYENSFREYVRQLYILAQQLSARWSEPYENPYLQGDATPQSLGGGLYDDFTQIESIFNTYQASEADNFYLALQAWDRKLRTEREGGQFSNTSIISLRKDILGYSEIVYDEVLERFKTKTEIKDEKLRQFQAYLLRHSRDDLSPFLLRLRFSLTYNQLSRSTSEAKIQPAVLNVSRSDWNVRITELSAKLVGNNIELFQYGKIEIISYHPRANEVYPNFRTFNLPLFFEDPEIRSTSPFKFSLNAGINKAGEVNSLVDVEPTPFCDSYILLIETTQAPMNIHNIEDIEFSIRWSSGVPPTFFN